MRSSVQISSPHSAYSAHKAFATCLWSRISVLGARHMSFSWHHNQGKVHLCCNKCQGPEQTRPNHLGKRLPKTRPHPWPMHCRSPLGNMKTQQKVQQTQQAQPNFSKYQLMRMRSGKYMEVQTDAAVLLHDHHSLQFDCRGSYVLLSFTNLIVLVAGNPTGGLHVTSSTDFKRLGRLQISMLQASIPKAGFPTFFPMFDPYIHVT